MADSDAAALPAGRTLKRFSLVLLLALVLTAAVVAGVLIGRATAPGPAIVVLPGPVVEESSAADQLSVSGLVDADTPAIFTPSPDLDDTSTTASGYRLSRSGLDGADVAQGLAAVFGVVGSSVRTSEGWTVESGSDATLTVRDDPMLSWTFADHAAEEASKGGVFVAPSRARAAATALLAGIGVDLDSVDWLVSRFDTSLAITATQLLGGQRTSLQWQISFGQNEAVVSASGFAAELAEVPGYEVVGAASAVRRAGLPTWSLIGPTLAADMTPAPVADAADAEITGAAEASTLQVEVSSIVVTDAELGLAQFRQPNGAVLILPAYQLTGDDGTLWSLIAVTGDYVNFVDRPFPGQPSPAP